MPHRVIQMVHGESIDIVFPSGTRINLEATQDTADILIGNRFLYSEERKEDNTGEWVMSFPKPFVDTE